MEPLILTPAQVAAQLRVTEKTLANWRSTGRYDLPYVKYGPVVGYRPEDVRAWVARLVVGAVNGG